MYCMWGSVLLVQPAPVDGYDVLAPSVHGTAPSGPGGLVCRWRELLVLL